MGPAHRPRVIVRVREWPATSVGRAAMQLRPTRPCRCNTGCTSPGHLPRHPSDPAQWGGGPIDGRESPLRHGSTPSASQSAEQEGFEFSQGQRATDRSSARDVAFQTVIRRGGDCAPVPLGRPSSEPHVDARGPTALVQTSRRFGISQRGSSARDRDHGIRDPRRSFDASPRRGRGLRDTRRSSASLQCGVAGARTWALRPGVGDRHPRARDEPAAPGQPRAGRSIEPTNGALRPDERVPVREGK
jgi:hypothetical protein